MLAHAALDLGGEGEDVGRRGAVEGDEEVGVLLAHAGAADGEALEAGVLDEARGRQLARRVLEVAAAGRVLERVLAAPQLGVAGDLGEQRVWARRAPRAKVAARTTRSGRDLKRLVR